jgi:hypothetical protein
VAYHNFFRLPAAAPGDGGSTFSVFTAVLLFLLRRMAWAIVYRIVHRRSHGRGLDSLNSVPVPR